MAGRPSDFKPEYCERLIEHMAEGLSFESFAGVIGTSRKTIYNWEKANPEFLHAKEIGTEKSRLFWESIGTEHILNSSESESTTGVGGSSSSKSINASVWIFNMKNRFGWRDKQPGEEDKTVTHQGQITVAKIDLDERIGQLKGQS